MKLYSQRDPKWALKKLGKSNLSIGYYGCFVTCLAMMSETTPDKVNEIIKNIGGFTSGGLIIRASSEQIAKELGLEYKGIVDTSYKPNFLTIAEVDMSPSPGKQQHFVVYDPRKNSIYDPWTGTGRGIGTYPIINFRLYKSLESPKDDSEEENNMDKKERGYLKDIFSELAGLFSISSLRGDHADEKDVDRIKKGRKEIKNNIKDLKSIADDYKKKLKKAESKNEELTQIANQNMEAVGLVTLLGEVLKKIINFKPKN